MHTSSNTAAPATNGSVRHRGRLLRHSALAVAIALSVAGLAAVAKPTPTLPDSSPLAAGQAAVVAPASFATLVEGVKPAVVNVSVTASTDPAAAGYPEFGMPDDPRFRDFFERFLRQSPAQNNRHGAAPALRSVGSGFIVTADGYIVTSHHVIENATEIEIVLNDGKRLPAEIRGSDPKTDLALLKIDAGQALPYVVFGDSDDARAGDWVVAIGNPFGLGGTATSGIVSARGRDIQSGPYDDYLQIDAPINRGNSGGPLFDTSGRVIGVNTAIFSPTGGNVGIGFAVPSAQAKPVIQQLMARGHVVRGWLGVQIQKLTEDLAASMQLQHTRGALVSSVTPDSPAARAGIKVGDVILAFAEREVSEMKDLPRLVADTAPGQKTRVTVWRQGEQRNLEVALARADEISAHAAALKPETAGGPRLGLALAPMSETLRQRFEVPGDLSGALVIEAEAGGAAALQGIRVGDVIVQAGGNPVSQPADVVAAVRESNASERDTVLLLVNRQGNQRFVTVPLG